MPAEPVRVSSAASVNNDWVRALQRTAGIEPKSDRTIGSVVAEMADAHPDRSALIGEHDGLTYAELSSRADRYALWALSRGLNKGDRVALMLDNQPDYVAIWIGLGRVGVVTALLNTQLVGAGLAHSLALSEAHDLIVGSPYLGIASDLDFSGTLWSHGADHTKYTRIETALKDASSAVFDKGDAVEVTLRDSALLIYTSGTTGLPKAAYVSHYRIMMWSEWFAGIMNATSDDRLFDCLPMYHSIGGVVAIGAMFAVGGGVVIRHGFSASRFWADVVETRATIFQYIGELCRYLLTHAASTSPPHHQIRLCVGNGLRADVWESFAQRFSIPRIIEFYAATEGSFSLFNLEGRPGAIGRIPRFMAHRSPVALVKFDYEAEAPIRDDAGFCQRCLPTETGEAIGMIADGPSSLATRFEGYTSEAETRRKILRDVFVQGDAWFRTGDLMRRDAEGFFYFVDRIGDTFRWKGENVATSDVADAIGAYGDVLDAAVYGVTVPLTDGRAGMASLVTSADFDLEAFRTHLVARLPRFARPVFLRIRSAMETTGTFKLKKQDLIREGFDPTVVSDTLYVDDPEHGAFKTIDADRFARIQSGHLKL